MTPRPRRPAQAGFSMVEMLMAAFILAIGILGLATLQAMTLKVTRGGHSLTNAVGAADAIMDQIELEGRLSWLNATSSSAATITPLTTLKYVGKGTQYLGFKESLNTTTNLVTLTPATTTPQASKPALAGNLRYVATITEGTATAAGTGQESNYTILVQFQDDVNRSGTAVVRAVTISRSILHG